MSVLDREPVRVYAGGVVAALIGVLLVYGLVDETQAAAWTALGLALTALPAVEIARSKVTPTKRPVDDEGAGELRLIGCVVIGVLVVYALVALL